MNINNENVFTDPNTIYHIANVDGFEYLTITTGCDGGKWYYGFSYLHLPTYQEKGIGSVGVMCNNRGKSFETEAGALLGAIKNIESHFDKNFRLKGAYEKYNQLIQLVIA
jgi:hypothetical protein